MGLVNFLKRFTNTKKTKSFVSGADFLRSYDNKEYTDIYSTWVFCCITCRAENLAKADMLLYSKSKNVSTEIFEHPFIDLINKENLYNQSFYEILYLISLNLDIYGNAYVYIARSNINLPDSFYVLPTHCVKPILNKSKNLITGYEYRSNQQTITYSPDEIIHFKLPSPVGNFTGIPTIASCKLTIQVDNLQQLYQRNFYKNDGSIGVALETDQTLSDETFQRAINQWNEKYSGVDNANRVAILEGGLKVNTYKGTPKEVDYRGSRKDLAEEVMGKLRVPKMVLGLSTDINRSSAEASLYTFIENVIKPFSKFISDKLNFFIRKNYDEKLLLKFEYPVLKNLNEEINLYNMLLNHEVLTKEEVREVFGYSTTSSK